MYAPAQWQHKVRWRVLMVSVHVVGCGFQEQFIVSRDDDET